MPPAAASRQIHQEANLADQELIEKLQATVGREYGRVNAWDEVNAPMIRHWCEVMGIDNPLYTDPAAARDAGYPDVVAPPAMLQVWGMAGLDLDNFAPGSTAANVFEILKDIEAYGYPGVVAVNSELSFDRYLHVGERLYYNSRIDQITEEKTTALGTGFFVTAIMTYFVERDEGDDERVGELLFRVFKFKPAERPKAAEPAAAKSDAPKAMRPLPGISDDSRFFWDGCREGKLLIQRCTACQTLQHPPAPVCSTCQSFELDHVQASGQGELYSFVVMHYPEVAPFEHPNPIGLVELDEGVRLVAGLVGVVPGELKVGQRLQVEFNTFDERLTLPQFRPVAG